MKNSSLETFQYFRSNLKYFIALLIFIFGFVGDAYGKDWSVFGITIGQPLTISDCEKSANDGGNPQNIKTMCVSHTWDMRKAWGVDDTEVYFPDNLQPDYIGSNSIGVSLFEGKVHSIAFQTTGYSVQNQVLSDLNKKFGKPTNIQKVIFQNAFGTKIMGLKVLWHKDHLVVNFDGIEGEKDHGRVEVSTEVYQKIYQDWKKRESATHKSL